MHLKNLHLTRQYFESGSVRLFEGSGGYQAGEQRRDFIHVDDVVKANLFFLDNPSKSGIFNVGTGNAGTFNDVALTVINACREIDGKTRLSLEDALREGLLNYFQMPDALVGKYQSYTEADIGRLNAAGFSNSFFDVEEGVDRYATELYNRLKEGERR